MKKSIEKLERRFEGMDILNDLLSQSGCELTAEDVVEEFHCAIEEGSLGHEIIALLWEQEPTFESPAVARRTFSNLFGLYEQMASDAVIDLIQLPDILPGQALTSDHCDRAWRVLDALTESDWRRARDEFDNRQAEIGTFVFEQLQHLEQRSVEAALTVTFEMWWILKSMRTQHGLAQPSRSTLESLRAKDSALLTETEPALAVHVSTSLWEQAAADEDPLSEAHIPLIEAVLCCARIALSKQA